MEYVLQIKFPGALFLRHILSSRLYCSVYNLSQLISKRLPQMTAKQNTAMKWPSQTSNVEYDQFAILPLESIKLMKILWNPIIDNLGLELRTGRNLRNSA